MDRFESMTAFAAVARAGGFSAAARQMGVPLATISRRVAELETALGVRLLQRSTRRVALTDAGRTFYATCERLLGDLKDAEDAMLGEYRTPRGELCVTAPLGFGRLHLQPVALDFLAAYPEINLRLMLVDRVVDLVDEHVDVALRIADLADSAMIARSLGPLNTWRFRQGHVDQTFPIQTRLATTSAESAIAAAQSGLGLAQTPCYQAERHVRSGELVILLQSFECAPTPVNLVYPTNRLLPLKLRAFIDFTAPRLSARVREIGDAVASRPVNT
jgi:DNA-binding transcriptional LysR family regulator